MAERTREEVIKILDELGTEKACSYTGEDMLSGKVSIDKLGGHWIRADVERLRKIKTQGKSSGYRENRFFDNAGNLI